MRALISVLLIVGSLGVARAFNAYLWLEGIPGESLETRHQDWIELTGFAEALAKSSGALPSFADFSFTKFQDRSSPLLFLRSANGKPITNATLELMQQSEVRNRFYRVVLSNCVVRAATVGGSAGSDRPMETVALSCDWISWTYTEFDGAGRRVGDTSAFWDLLRNAGTRSFRLTGTKQGANMIVSWQATLGTTYRLSGSSAITGPYAFVQSVTPTSNGVVKLSFPIGTGNLFYRAETGP